MWTVVLIGTGFTVLAVPAWLSFRERWGVEGMALASSVVMTLFAATMFLMWRRDTATTPEPALLVSMGRALTAGVVAGTIGYAVVDAIAGEATISLLTALLAVVVGAVTVTAAYLILAFAMRSEELGDLRRRRPDVIDPQE
jgi:peptidoglycan biosynthesis protein MviN/MurJ (putative lipid II flippase)